MLILSFVLAAPLYTANTATPAHASSQRSGDAFEASCRSLSSPQRGTPASLSLKERKEIKKAEKELEKEHLSKMNEQCGTDIKYDLKWKQFTDKTNSTYTLRRVAVFCGGVLDGIAQVCGSDMGKQAVKAKLDKVTCAFDEKASYENLERYGPTLSINGGTLKAGYNKETSNAAADTEEWLMSHL
jgi:hypothetical protein